VKLALAVVPCLQKAYFYLTIALGLAYAYIGLGMNDITDKAMTDIQQVRPDVQIDPEIFCLVSNYNRRRL